MDILFKILDRDIYYVWHYLVEACQMHNEPLRCSFKKQLNFESGNSRIEK